MSNLTELCEGLILVFHKYSQLEGDKFTLTKGELKILLQNEFGEVLKKSNNPSMVDDVMQELDKNKDNVVDFREFLVLFATLTILCHNFFKDYMSK